MPSNMAPESAPVSKPVISAGETTNFITWGQRFSVFVLLFLILLACNPATVTCAVPFAIRRSRHTGVRIPVAPSLPPDFKMDVVVRPWYEKDVSSCTLAYTSENRDLGNLLYVNCLSKDVNSTKFYDFYKDVLLEHNGKTNETKVVKGIPETEKFDPYFPVEFRTEGDRKVFDKPDSLIHFGGKRQRPAQDSPMEEHGWTNEKNVTIQGHTEECTNHIAFTRESAVSPYCDGKGPARVHCPLVPLAAGLYCGDDKIIHYSFHNYVEEYDYSIFEPYLEKLRIQNVTETSAMSTAVPGRRSYTWSLAKGVDTIYQEATEGEEIAPSTLTTFTPDPSTGGLSPGVRHQIASSALVGSFWVRCRIAAVTGLFMASGSAILLVMSVVGKKRQARRARTQSPTGPGVEDEEATSSLTSKTRLSNGATYSRLQVYSTENSTSADKTEITSDDEGTLTQEGVCGTNCDPKATPITQPEQSSECTGCCQELQLVDDQASSVIARSPHSQDPLREDDCTQTLSIHPGQNTGRRQQTFLSCVALKKGSECPDMKAGVSTGAQLSTGSQGCKVSTKDRAVACKGHIASTRGSDNSQTPLLNDHRLEVPG